MVGYAWCAVALAITWVSDWAVITEMDTIFGYSPFDVKDSYALAWLLFPGAVVLLACYFLEKRFGIGLTKRSAQKQYVTKLSRLLAMRYGKSRQYTQGQIKRTIKEYRCNSSYIIYAYAAFLNQEEFQALNQNADASYHELRDELANNFFDGNATFDGASLADLGLCDGAGDGASGGGDGSVGGGGDGGGDG